MRIAIVLFLAVAAVTVFGQSYLSVFGGGGMPDYDVEARVDTLYGHFGMADLTPKKRTVSLALFPRIRRGAYIPMPNVFSADCKILRYTRICSSLLRCASDIFRNILIRSSMCRRTSP